MTGDLSAMSIPVTVLVQTKNEERGITECLSSLTDFDEIVVVDSKSTDRTQELAHNTGAQVVVFDWDGGYPKKKQWQLDNVQARNEWVLFLDADESPSRGMLSELERMFCRGSALQHRAYDVSLDYWFAGRKLKFGHRVVKRALVRRDSVTFPPVEDLSFSGMGELEGHYQPVVQGTVGRLKARLEHRDLDPVRTWFDRHNRYSDWEARNRLSPHVRAATRSVRSKQGRLFELVPGKAIVFFFYCYVLRLGFLDARAGFDYAVALSWYYWLIGLKVRELKASWGS